MVVSTRTQQQHYDIRQPKEGNTMIVSTRTQQQHSDIGQPKEGNTTEHNDFQPQKQHTTLVK
jgi:hypothetical protein